MNNGPYSLFMVITMPCLVANDNETGHYEL